MPRKPAKAAAAVQEIGLADTFYVGTLDGSGLVGLPYGHELVRELWRMSLMDETVGAMDWCIKTVMAQVSWEFVPEKDGKLAETDAKAIAAKEFGDSLLIDMSHTMQEHIEEATSMVIFGFAPHEIVLKQRDGKNSRFNDKLYGIAKLPLRDQVGINQWIYDGNDAVAFVQSAATGTATIPLWKTLHYRTSSRLDRPMGRPLLLNALRAWKLKEKIQDSEAIGIERDLCGLPTFRVPEEVLNASKEVYPANHASAGQPTTDAMIAMAKIQGAIKAVRDMRFNQTGGLIMPSDTFFEDTSEAGGPGDRTPKWDFKLVTTAGSRSIDTRTAARDYDRAIARVAMMQFLHLGDRSTGSYALSDDQSSLAIRSLMALAMKIAGEWGRKLTPLIWDINGMDKAYMPRLRASEISKDGIVQIGQLLRGMGGAAGFWETDVEMRMALAKLANLPADRDAQQAAVDRAIEMANEPPAPTFGAPANSNQSARPKAAALPGDDDEDA
jgi:hypothetical protein